MRREITHGIVPDLAPYGGTRRLELGERIELSGARRAHAGTLDDDDARHRAVHYSAKLPPLPAK